MEQLAGVIVSWLIRQEAIEEESRELYEYAVHSFFLGITPLIYAVIIGGLMGEVRTSIVLILPFMIIRKFSGGFHAKREWVCLVSSCLLLFGCIFTASHIEHNVLFDAIVIWAVVSLIVCSPIDSENRRLEPDEKKLRKKETTIISLFFYIVYIGLLLLGKQSYAVCIGTGMILTAGLQVPCIIKNIAKKCRKMSFHDTRIEK